VYPSIGNHDADESEDCDDRAQVEDNFYLRERIAGEEGAGRASFGPGLFYRIRYGSNVEFVCIDTSKEGFFKGHRLFEYPKHWRFLEQAFPAAGPRPAWLIPFSHHPPFSAGPQHHNTKGMERLIPLFERSDVRVVFSGHEHNFQHSVAEGIHYFVSGAAGRRRTGVPDRFTAAHTQSWSPECHFLLARIQDQEMSVRAIGELAPPVERLTDIPRHRPDGTPVTGAVVIRRA
jgi:3',5'-cyclic AMP phosphodiesterase CpdA